MYQNPICFKQIHFCLNIISETLLNYIHKLYFVKYIFIGTKCIKYYPHTNQFNYKYSIIKNKHFILLNLPHDMLILKIKLISTAIVEPSIKNKC